MLSDPEIREPVLARNEANLDHSGNSEDPVPSHEVPDTEAVMRPRGKAAEVAGHRSSPGGRAWELNLFDCNWVKRNSGCCGHHSQYQRCPVLIHQCTGN